MKTFDCTANLPAALDDGDYRLCRADGTEAVVRTSIQHEHRLSIVVNGQLAFTLVCTPQHMAELALGRLFGEGFIAGIGDVASLHSCQQGDVVKVRLVHDAPLRPAPAVAISTCNAAREAHLARCGHQQLAPLPHTSFRRRWVFEAAAAFSKDTPMHKRTRGAHSCFLVQEGRVLFACEDLGRHNAFDKAVGWGLRHGVDFSRCFAITSGRVPTDMAAKAVNARIPVLLSASVPTGAALQFAREKGLTLIGRIAADAVAVYHDPTNSMAQTAPEFAAITTPVQQIACS